MLVRKSKLIEAREAAENWRVRALVAEGQLAMALKVAQPRHPVTGRICKWSEIDMGQSQ